MDNIETIVASHADALVEEYGFAVDTALSWEGVFPPAAEGDYLVEVETIVGYVYNVLVSGRYTAPDADEAREIALDAVIERADVQAKHAAVLSVRLVEDDSLWPRVAGTSWSDMEVPCWPFTARRCTAKPCLRP